MGSSAMKAEVDLDIDAKPRVLLVDDEPLILSSYGRMLAAMDVEVVLAEGAEEGLTQLEQTPVDVVIADYRMPGMKGDEFLERLREEHPDTVRILNTGYADVEVVEQVVRRGGIFRFLTKPCSAEKLREAVSEALEHHHLQWESRRRSEQLQLNLQSYRMIFNSALDPMMVSDLEGNLVEVNDAFVAASGFASRHDALLGRPTIMSYWRQEQRWRSILKRVREEGHWSDEVSHKTEERYALLSISLVNNDDGRPFALVAIEKDITARRKLEQESRAAQYEVILALAKLAEYRDPETFAHLERMRRYSQILTIRLGKNPRYAATIDNEYVEAVFASSPLHDVGKVGIPDSVLLKPGKLTKEEWDVMQLHTRIGAQILSVAGSSLTEKTWLAMGRTIALQHHEKIDGSGYPQGLKGDEIDLSARIVALADAYDAITSKRVYKDAFPHDEARKRILESSGSHFDPDVVEAFLDCEEEFTQVKDEYIDPPAVTDVGDIMARVQRLLGIED
jgi:PAS domain S-box-containing protein